jgi:hypothetical protein
VAFGSKDIRQIDAGDEEIRGKSRSVKNVLQTKQGKIFGFGVRKLLIPEYAVAELSGLQSSGRKRGNELPIAIRRLRVEGFKNQNQPGVVYASYRKGDISFLKGLDDFNKNTSPLLASKNSDLLDTSMQTRTSKQCLSVLWESLNKASVSIRE